VKTKIIVVFIGGDEQEKMTAVHLQQTQEHGIIGGFTGEQESETG